MKYIHIYAFATSVVGPLNSLAANPLAGDTAKGKEIYNTKNTCGTCDESTDQNRFSMR